METCSVYNDEETSDEALMKIPTGWKSVTRMKCLKVETARGVETLLGL